MLTSWSAAISRKRWGYEIYHDQLVIIASDHNHGTFLPIDLAKPVTIDTLRQRIRPFAGVA